MLKVLITLFTSLQQEVFLLNNCFFFSPSLARIPELCLPVQSFLWKASHVDSAELAVRYIEL